MMLNPETLYVVYFPNSDETWYARTPNGEGCYWYSEDEKQAAESDVCYPKQTRHFDSPQEFEDFRYGPV